MKRNRPRAYGQTVEGMFELKGSYCGWSVQSMGSRAQEMLGDGTF